MFIIMEIIARCLGPVQTNCYLLIKEGHALLIDPGGPFPDLDALLKQHHAQLDAVLLTHSHFDHIEGLDSVMQTQDCPVYIHPAEVDFLADSVNNGSQSFMIPFVCHTKARELKPGHHTFGPFRVEMIHTPGHTIGSSVFLVDGIMFSGDTIFQGSIGRTDLPTGDLQAMMHSLQRLKQIQTDCPIYPGHGPATTLEQEKQWNPYLR